MDATALGLDKPRDDSRRTVRLSTEVAGFYAFHGFTYSNRRLISHSPHFGARSVPRREFSLQASPFDRGN